MGCPVDSYQYHALEISPHVVIDDFVRFDLRPVTRVGLAVRVIQAVVALWTDIFTVLIGYKAISHIKPHSHLTNSGRIQGDPSGLQLYLDDFDLGVPPSCLHAMPILPDLQVPKQNKADIGTTKSKLTKCR